MTEIGSIAVFVTGLAYALGYTAQDAFYAEFGLSLEQAGIDKVAALLRLTPLAFIVTIAASLFVAVTVASVEFLRRRFRVRAFRHAPALVVTAAVLGALGLLGFIGSVTGSRATTEAAGRLVSISFVGFVGVAIGVWVMSAIVWFIFDTVTGRLTANVVATVVVVACAGIALQLWVSDTAVELRDRGFPLVEPTTLQMVGIPVAIVDVRWKDPARRPPALATPGPQRLLLALNDSGGRYTLYDCVSNQVIRVSDSDADIDRYLGPLVGNRRTEAEWSPRVPPCLIRPT